MKNNRLRCVIVPAVSMLALIARPSDASDIEIAEQRYDEAHTAIAEEQYERALQLFETSYRLNPTPKALFNIGMTLKALKRNLAAYRTLKQALELENPGLDDEEKIIAAQSAIDELKTTIGYLMVISDLDGIDVSVGKESLGKTPFENEVALHTGNQEIVCSKAGYETWRKKITIPQNGTLQLNVDLEVEKGAISVACEEGALVYVNGETAGACPLSKRVIPGTYDVTVTARDKVSAVRTVTVQSGRTVDLQISLADVASAAPAPDRPSGTTPAFLISGIAATVLGVAGLGVGIGFTIRSENNYQDVVGLVNKANDAAEVGDWEAYDDYVIQYESAKDDWEKNQRPADRAGIIAGYVVGVTLTAAGGVLFGMHFKKKRAETVSVTPGFGNVIVSF